MWLFDDGPHEPGLGTGGSCGDHRSCGVDLRRHLLATKEGTHGLTQVDNNTPQDYYFGPLHLPASASNFYVDDTSATSLYLTDDGVADAINTLAAANKITVTGAALPFPRPTGTPEVLHGDGAPEGLIYGGQGSLYLTRTATDIGSFLYMKSTGVHLNTGWLLISPSASPSGTIIQYAGATTPSGYLPCDGAAVSRATYATLFNALTALKGPVTVTIASPSVFTLNSHGFVVGDAIFLETSGALPTGLSADTTYYVIAAGLTTNTFQVSTSPGGTAVSTSGTQSGIHDLYYAPYGVANATTFNVPDLRGRTPVGRGSNAVTAALGASDGIAEANRRGTKHRHTPHAHSVSVGNISGTPATPPTGTAIHKPALTPARSTAALASRRIRWMAAPTSSATI